MRGLESTFSELNYNEIGKKAAYAVVAIDAFKDKIATELDKKFLNDAIYVCERLLGGFEATQSSRMTVSQLAQYHLVSPIVGPNDTRLSQKQTEEVLGLLNRYRENNFSDPLSISQYKQLNDYFREVSSTYLNLAKAIISSRNRE